MKRTVKRLLATLFTCCCLLLAPLSASAHASESVEPDGYFPLTGASAVFASEKIAVVGENVYYLADYDYAPNKVETVTCVGAEKVLIDQNTTYVLADGTLTANGETVAQNVTDFDVKNGAVAYLSDGNVCYRNGSDTPLSVSANALSVALGENGVYYAVKEDGMSVYWWETTKEPTQMFRHKQSFDSLLYDNEKVWGVSENTLYDMQSKTVVDPSCEACWLRNGTVYWIAMEKLYADDTFVLGVGKTLLYPTRLTSDGFGITALDDNGATLFSATEGKWTAGKPLTVSALDLASVGDGSGKIWYAADNTATDGQTEYSYPAAVTSIACAPDGTVYASADGVYRNQEKIYEKSGLVAVNRSTLDWYLYADGVFYKNGESWAQLDGVSAFDVDSAGTVFALAGNDVWTVTETEQTSVPSGAVKAADICLLLHADYAGKVAVADTNGHTVIITDVSGTLASYEDDLQTRDVHPVVTVTKSALAFSDMARTTILSEIPAKTTVFCLKNDIPSDKTISLIAYESQGKLVKAYVNRSVLSSPLSLTPTLYDKATTFYDNVEAYALPHVGTDAPNATVLRFTQAGTEVELMGKLNVFGRDWYQVQADGKVGFIPLSSLQMGGYVPGQRPDTNAALTDSARIYDKKNGEYVNSDTMFLAKGTKIEVVGTFDSNTEYTQIRYFDKEAGGTRTCYVKTDLIRYDYMTAEQKIAIGAVIFLTISTLVVILIFGKNTKKN